MTKLVFFIVGYVVFFQAYVFLIKLFVHRATKG